MRVFDQPSVGADRRGLPAVGSKEEPQDSSNPAAFIGDIPARGSIDNDAINRM
jgi:hypothetical protein